MGDLALGWVAVRRSNGGAGSSMGTQCAAAPATAQESQSGHLQSQSSVGEIQRPPAERIGACGSPFHRFEGWVSTLPSRTVEISAATEG